MAEDDIPPAVNVLQEDTSTKSLQNPPLSSSTNSSDVDLSQLSPQEAANQLYCNSEILAPMVRASTIPLRTLALSHGASLTYTEELVDRCILPTQRIINKELGTIDYRLPISTYSAKVQKRMMNDKDNPDSKHGAVLLRIDPVVEKNKLIYQIGTGESNFALQAATKVINDVNGMDVNMGCPKKFSVSGGMGSALLSDVKRACDIISTLRRNLSKPVTAKIRLLDPNDPQPTLDFVRSLIKAGANAITIHGRIVGDESHTMARWTTLVEVVRQLKQTESVPIIVNGDLYTRADVREMKRRTGCNGIMLARPALYNISLFRKGQDEATHDVDITSKDDEIPLPTFQTTNHQGMYGYNSPLLHSRTSIVQEYISHCVRYRAHSKNAKYVVCEMMNSRRAPTNRVPFLNMEYETGQTIASVCKCKSLNDLVKIWDVTQTIPLPTAVNNANVLNTCKPNEIEAAGDLHNYDDRYFLDHDKFRNERKEEVEKALTDDKTGEDSPVAKRPKI